MKEGKCTKGFPKPFKDRTNMDVDGYPEYRRPNDGRCFPVGKDNIYADNSWIVPYNPFLSAKYNCHINVECASSLAAFKYIFKYINKGTDLASADLEKDDEITRHIHGHYISASESAWRIFQFETHDRKPAVTRLQVHLENEHCVVFNADQSSEEASERLRNSRTTLTAFFEANSDQGELGEIARQHTYQDFPQFFTWKSSEKKWGIRKQCFSIGRMYFVHPTAGEKFYLRLLLTVVKGPTSFADLKTFNGKTYSSFRDACAARGLLESDQEWLECLTDAGEMQTGSSLRQLFASLLRNCAPCQPSNLWQKCRAKICDDLRFRLRRSNRPNPTAEEVYDYGLFLIDGLLQRMGRRLRDYDMPLPQLNWETREENVFVNEQLNYDHEQQALLATDRYSHFNVEQRDAYNKIMSSVEKDAGQTFFLSGAGGTGKTYVYNTLCNKVRSQGGIVLAVVSSGIAAVLIEGGRTAHSTFKLPLQLNDTTMCNIAKKDPHAILLQQTKLIIWDEITMQHRHAPEAVDRTCRDIRNAAVPFGGITVVFGGDFQQILPVVPHGKRDAIVDATIKRSPLWQNIQILQLHRNIRLESDPASLPFHDWLLSIGQGHATNEKTQVQFPPHMLSHSPQELIDYVYPGISDVTIATPHYFAKRMILAPLNTNVASMNSDILAQMNGEDIVCPSVDTIIEDKSDNTLPCISPEVLRSIEQSNLPSGELHLKIGCPLILLRNLAPNKGLCNGTRMVLLQMTPRVLQVQLTSGDRRGQNAFIPRISLFSEGSQAERLPFKFSRRQFPVKLAFALTINKSQGQGAHYVGLDLRTPVFTHGQLYVAMSRATSAHRIKVLLEELESNTTNIVYNEVLLH